MKFHLHSSRVADSHHTFENVPMIMLGVQVIHFERKYYLRGQWTPADVDIRFYQVDTWDVHSDSLSKVEE